MMNMARAMRPNVCAATAIAAILVTIGAAPIVSQAPAATAQTSPQVASEPVTLDLTVRDRHNKPVLDLRPEDLSVTDDGKPARLSDLQLVNGKSQDRPLITLFFDRPGMPDRQKKRDAFLVGGSGSQARGTSRKLQQIGMKFLRAFPSNGYRFAVADAWGRLQIQQEYVEDHKAINDAILAAVQPEIYGKPVQTNAVEQHVIDEAKTGLGSQGKAVSARDRAVARSLYAALETSSRIANDQHLSLSRSCLMALVEAQRSLPGRKAVVYFTSPQNISGETGDRAGRDSHSREALRSIIGAANRAGVSLYVVLTDELEDTDQLAGIESLNGMKYSSPASSTGAGNADIFGGVTPSMGDVTTLTMASSSYAGTKSVLAAQEDMNMLARQTGGEVLNGNGNVTEPVKGLIRDLTTYYDVSFVPAGGAEDGSFHSTVFKTSRRGLKMRTRTGYLALPPGAATSHPPQPFELPLVALLKRKELPSDLDYRASVLRMGHGDEGNVGLLALEVPVSGLQIRKDTSTHLNSAHLSVLATVFDGEGTEVERFSEDIARRWATGGSAGSAPDVISFERSFAAPPGKYVLETAILDNNSGKAAARRQAFEISAAQSLPEISDLLVVRDIEPIDEAGSEPDVLWRGGQRVEPNLYGQLPAGAHNVMVFFLAHPDAKSPEPATVKLEVLRDGVPLKGEPLTTTLKPGTEFAPVLKGFAIRSAADGKYEIRATLTQDGKTAKTAGAFVLTGEEAQSASGGAGATTNAPVEGDPPGLEPAEQTADHPSQEDLDGILADVRKNALNYGDMLPNLICQQTTTRLIDARGNGDWRLEDSIVEVLTYLNHEESRTVAGGEANHKMVSAEDVTESGMISSGEFGVALSNIFKPESKAQFTWNESAMLRGEAVEVFDYRIAQENAPFSLRVHTVAANVGYHGQIYVDRATRGVMSLTMITDAVPEKFPVHKAAIRVDYDYVAIGDHDFLLPVSAQVTVSEGRNVLERNDIEFTNFRKYGSTARMVGAGSEATP